MQTVKITTSQNIDIEYEMAGLGERMVAYLIDWGILFLVYYAAFIVMTILNLVPGTGPESSAVIFGIVIFVIIILFALYDLICEVFLHGQSFGKKLMKIRVVSIDGTSPRLGQYLLRWIFRLVDFTLTFQLGGLISVTTSKPHQRIGDRVAGTTVIKTKPRTQLEDIAFIPPEENYQPLFPEAERLNSRDIELIHEVIRNFKESGNNVLVYNLAVKLSEHLSVQIPAQMNEMEFIQALLKDHNAITSAVPI